VYPDVVASAEGDNTELAQKAAPPVPRRRATAQGAPGANPTVRQRQLGRRLRELRNGLGLTVEDVGQELLCSATKISRLETGARRASLRDVRDLCRVYGVTSQADADDLMNLARRAREPGWWTRYDDLGLSPYIGLEQEAVAITSFSMYYVPALLQTAEYAHAIIRSIERRMDLKIIDQRVEARILRQQLLERESPPRYRVLLDEAVLHRQISGPAGIRAQLDKILRYAEEEKVIAQVVQFDVGGHGATDSNFDLLEFSRDSLQSPVVYVEGLFTNRYYERPEQIERYREALEYLRDVALSPRDSNSLIAKMRDAHKA
jgi:transcriptional regulator with XRE-family HTH domain